MSTIETNGRATTDIDAEETREWLEALDAVLRNDGADRARFLLERAGRAGAAASARRRRSAARRRTSTRSRVDQEPPYPGDPSDRAAHPHADPLERDGDGGARQQGVLRARRPHRELPVGGDALRGRLQPLLARAVARSTAATSSSSRATRAPGIYARAFLEGRLTEEQLRRFRQEIVETAATARHLVLSAPVADAGLLAVPDRVDGPRADHGDLPGALHELPHGPRARRHRAAARCGRFLGDGEMDEPESLGAISLAGAREARQPGLRRQLQPAAARRAGARQRQDHPGARDGLPRRRLERDQGRSGARAGTRCSRATPTGLLRRAHGGGRRRRVPDVQGARRRLRARALLRQATRSCARWSRTCPTTRSGRSTAAATTRARSTPPTRRPCAHTGQPTVILAKTIKGYGMGEAGEGQNITHQQKKMTDERAAARSATASSLDADRRAGRRRRRSTSPPDDSPEMTLPARAPRRRSAAGCRPRRAKADAAGGARAVGVRARS